MATCPRCGTALKDEYGMSQCPACGAFSFIDMDGEAVIQETSPQEAIAPDSSAPKIDPTYDERNELAPSGAAAPPDFNDPIEDLIGVSSPGTSPLSSANESVSGGVEDSQPFDSFAVMPPMEAPFTPDSNAPQEFMNAEFQSIDTSPQSQEEVSEPPAFGPANDPLNLNEFANSEVSSAKDGPLLFRVLISGIDTKEIRDSIREVLEDSRFAWDSNEIFSKVSKGHLAIKGLSPVKASILITRIKRLPVQIRWEQYAITQGQA